MIPRVASLGHGFAGAGLYYLNDKQQDTQPGRPTPDEYMLSPKQGSVGSRVDFTETRNLPTRDPHKALRCMQWLAAHAQDVRLAAAAAAARAAGMSYEEYVRTKNPFRGRRGVKPVYTMSIAWHPTKNDKPRREHMIAAADEVIRALGMTDRQCLMVAHTDTAHPHIHLIINRVSPINGKFANVGNDWLKLSAWALDYERRTGHILCFERMLNWEKRRGHREAKAQASLTDNNARGLYVRGKDTPRRDLDWWKAHRHLPDDALRSARADRQSGELKDFQNAFAKAIVVLETHAATIDNKKIKQLQAEVARRQGKYLAKHNRPANRTQRAIHAIRRMADYITGRDFRENRHIKSLNKSITALEQRLERDRASVRSRYAKAWISLEKRHAAERERDERRIAERSRKDRGDAAISRARKQFNVRSDASTAAKLSPKIAPGKLSRHFRRYARSKLAERLEGRSALARIVGNLSGKQTNVDDLRRESLVRPNENTKDKRSTAKFDPALSNAMPIQGQINSPKAAARETEIEAEMCRVKEAKEERHRRKRSRPRGRTRKIE
jgi:hypothetical protein